MLGMRDMHIKRYSYLIITCEIPDGNQQAMFPQANYSVPTESNAIVHLLTQNSRTHDIF